MAFVVTSTSMPSSFASLERHDPVANAKGQKNAVIVHRDGAPALWTLSSSVKPLFQPSSFNSADNGRKSLCLSVPPEVMVEATSLDDWAICYAQQHSERLFGKALNQEQVKERYMGVVKNHDKYPAYLKVKIAVDLRNQPLY